MNTDVIMLMFMSLNAFFWGGREKVRGSPLFRNEFINSIRSANADSIYHLTLSY